MIDTPYVSPVYKISQHTLNQFAEASGGISKIHTDPEYAQKTPFGATLVHGLLLFALMEKELQSHITDWHEKGKLEATFVRPVKCEDEFTIHLEKNDDNEIIVTVVCEEQTVIAGKAIILEERRVVQ